MESDSLADKFHYTQSSEDEEIKNFLNSWTAGMGEHSTMSTKNADNTPIKRTWEEKLKKFNDDIDKEAVGEHVIDNRPIEGYKPRGNTAPLYLDCIDREENTLIEQIYKEFVKQTEKGK